MLTDEISQQFYNICLEYSPKGEYRSLYEGIICGKSLRGSPYYDLFQTSGLLHLIVVSGSHLIFLSQIMERLQIRSQKIHILILSLYVLVCRLQAPALRSYVYILLSSFATKYKSHTPNFYLHILTIFYCLCLVPHYAKSLSFLLSINAAIAISLSTKHIKQNIYVFVILLPMLYFYSPQASSIIINIFVSPIIGSIMFPLSLICMLLPPLSLIGDTFWQVSLLFLRGIQSYLPTTYHPASFQSLPYSYYWFYTCLLLILTKKQKS